MFPTCWKKIRNASASIQNSLLPPDIAFRPERGLFSCGNARLRRESRSAIARNYHSHRSRELVLLWPASSTAQCCQPKRDETGQLFRLGEVEIVNCVHNDQGDLR